MSAVPQISGKELVKALAKVGFQVIRQKGSHIRLSRLVDGKWQTVIVPNHKVIRNRLFPGQIFRLADTRTRKLSVV